MPAPTLTNAIIDAAILGFEEQKRRIDVQIADLRAMLSGRPADLTTAPEPTRPSTPEDECGRTESDRRSATEEMGCG